MHRFAAANLTRNYINCYWATEHGGIVCTRLLWLFSPRLLSLLGSPILRLFVASWKPDFRATSLPYILLRCPFQSTKSLTDCGRDLLFNANECMWNQWSAMAMTQDAFGLAILMCTMCAWAAITPRRRIPLVTVVGEHSLACYVASHTLVIFFAPIFEGVANYLVRLGLIPMRPVVEHGLFSLVLFSLMTFVFWSFASLIGPTVSALTRQSTTALAHLQAAAPTEVRSLLPPKTPRQRRVAYAVAIVMLVTVYDGSPAACESSKYKQSLARPPLPTCEFVRKDDGAWAVERASSVSRPLTTYVSLGGRLPTLTRKHNGTSAMPGKWRGRGKLMGGRAGRAGMGRSRGWSMGRAGGVRIGGQADEAARARLKAEKFRVNPGKQKLGTRMHGAKSGGGRVARWGGNGMSGAGQGKGAGTRVKGAKPGGGSVARWGGNGVLGAVPGRITKAPTDLPSASSALSCCDGQNAQRHPARNWRKWAARDSKNFCSHAWFTRHCVTAPAACRSSLWNETCSEVFCVTFDGSGGSGPCRLQAAGVCKTCRACYERGCPMVA